MFYFGKELVFHLVLGLLPLSEKRRNVPIKQVYPNKQSLETEGSNSTFSEATKRHSVNLVQALIKLDMLRRLYFLRSQSFIGEFICCCNASVNFKPDHPPRATPGDSHILVARGVGFSLLCLARGFAPGVCPRGVLNQSKRSTILKKARFLPCLLNKWVAALFICLNMLEVSSLT